jgi:hypothetical protein
MTDQWLVLAELAPAGPIDAGEVAGFRLVTREPAAVHG